MYCCSSRAWFELAYWWRARQRRYSRRYFGKSRQLLVHVTLLYWNHLGTSGCASAMVAVPAARTAVSVTAAMRRLVIRAFLIRISHPRSGWRVIGPVARRGRSWVLNHLLCCSRLLRPNVPVLPRPIRAEG